MQAPSWERVGPRKRAFVDPNELCRAGRLCELHLKPQSPAAPPPLFQIQRLVLGRWLSHPRICNASART